MKERKPVDGGDVSALIHEMRNDVFRVVEGAPTSQQPCVSACSGIAVSSCQSASHPCLALIHEEDSLRSRILLRPQDLPLPEQERPEQSAR